MTRTLVVALCLLSLAFLPPLAPALPVPPVVFGSPNGATAGELVAECHGFEDSACTMYFEWPYESNTLHLYASSCNRSLETCDQVTGVVRFTCGSDGQGTDQWGWTFVNGVSQGFRRISGDGWLGWNPLVTLDIAKSSPGAVPEPAFLSGNPGGQWHAWVSVSAST